MVVTAVHCLNSKRHIFTSIDITDATGHTLTNTAKHTPRAHLYTADINMHQSVAKVIYACAKLFLS
jgi:hypothetical protein